MKYLITGNESSAKVMMDKVDELIDLELQACPEIRAQVNEINELTRSIEGKEESVATSYRWNQDKMNSWLKNYFDKWQEGDFFQSGAGLGNFNRVLYNIHWAESAPKKSYRPEDSLQFPPNPRNVEESEPNCENWCDCHPY